MPTVSYRRCHPGPARRLEAHRAPPQDRGRRWSDKLPRRYRGRRRQDALPLLAFTLERPFTSARWRPADLRLDEYNALGGISADRGRGRAAFTGRPMRIRPTNERGGAARIASPRSHPLASPGWTRNAGVPRRRVAQLLGDSDRGPALILAPGGSAFCWITDVAKGTRETTIEVAHEGGCCGNGDCCRIGWPRNAGLLAVLEAVKRASREWEANGRSSAWLTHATSRLETAERLKNRPDLAANVDQSGWDYWPRAAATSGRNEAASCKCKPSWSPCSPALSICCLRRSPTSINGSACDRCSGTSCRTSSRRHPSRPCSRAPRFKECANCPEMVVIPAGAFVMGQADSDTDEVPLHAVTIVKPLAVAKFEVTFDEWDACVAHGGCTTQPSDGGWGRGARPVILRELGRRPAICGLALAADRKELSAAVRGRMGICDTGPNNHGLSVGRRDRSRARRLHRLRRRLGRQAADGARRLVCAQRVRPRGHGRQMCGSGCRTAIRTTITACRDDGSAGGDSRLQHRSSAAAPGGDDPDSLRSAFRNWDAGIVRGYDLGFRLARTLGP